MSKKRIIVLLILVAVAVWYWQQPSYWQELWKVDQVLTTEHGVNKKQLAEETKAIVATAIRTKKVTQQSQLHEALMPSANRAAMLDTERDAWLLRTQRRIPVLRQPVVYGTQKAWEEKFQASEPLLIKVGLTDQICSGDRPQECFYADGIYKNQTPAWQQGNKTALQDPDPQVGGNTSNLPGGYGALIVRTCQGNTCSNAEEAGFVFAACAANNQTTTVKLWTNRYTKIGPISDRSDFSGTGSFTFEVVPDDPRAITACALNRSAGFVRLDQVPVLTVRIN